MESALKDRYQTTVQQPVRRAVGLRKRDRICYAICVNGVVVLQRLCPEPVEDNPALASFLAEGSHSPPNPTGTPNTSQSPQLTYLQHFNPSRANQALDAAMLQDLQKTHKSFRNLEVLMLGLIREGYGKKGGEKRH